MNDDYQIANFMIVIFVVVPVELLAASLVCKVRSSAAVHFNSVVILFVLVIFMQLVMICIDLPSLHPFVFHVV